HRIRNRHLEVFVPAAVGLEAEPAVEALQTCFGGRPPVAELFAPCGSQHYASVVLVGEPGEALHRLGADALFTHAAWHLEELKAQVSARERAQVEVLKAEVLLCLSGKISEGLLV